MSSDVKTTLKEIGFKALGFFVVLVAGGYLLAGFGVGGKPSPFQAIILAILLATLEKFGSQHHEKHGDDGGSDGDAA
ncbi:hypothetical protein [Kordiimonas marina]|uniref:hypothetical protein n=1 Tax=Kordiimonas marina TaxID=2872312 RepID=UPI001FF671E4|nr:hypothetical protein [Kordiimonas marina]MCJ9429261.1 hypothetical protein [Kordiimonas marina]